MKIKPLIKKNLKILENLKIIVEKFLLCFAADQFPMALRACTYMLSIKAKTFDKNA